MNYETPQRSCRFLCTIQKPYKNIFHTLEIRGAPDEQSHFYIYNYWKNYHICYKILHLLHICMAHSLSSSVDFPLLVRSWDSISFFIIISASELWLGQVFSLYFSVGVNIYFIFKKLSSVVKQFSFIDNLMSRLTCFIILKASGRKTIYSFDNSLSNLL